MHLRFAVLPGSQAAGERDVWLAQRQRRSLAELRCLIVGPQGRGHDVPWKRPPPDHDATGIPHLTRSALHRCLQRHGISRLPDVEGDKSRRQKFKRYPIGPRHCS